METLHDRTKKWTGSRAELGKLDIGNFATSQNAWKIRLSVLRSLSPWSSASVPAQLGAGSSLAVEDHARPFLVSPDATFSCGFLEAGENAFSFSVWYTNAADKTAVWTANPGAPVNGRGSRISFRGDGGLALADGNGTAVWESMTSGEGLAISLLDSGNLVISDPFTGGGRAVWQSFDWPTDTLVPSQPFTKETRLVAGYFNLHYDNDNVLRLLYDGPDTSSIYWPNPGYTVIGNGRTNNKSLGVAVLDDAGVFLSSDNLLAKSSDLGPGIKQWPTLDQDGNLRIYSLNESTGGWAVSWAAVQQPCSTQGLCGQNAICEYQPSLKCSCLPGYEMANPRDWRYGCKPMFSISSCIHAAPEQFKFVELQHTDFYGYDLGYNSSVSFEYCKKLCMEMCSCTAFSYRLTGTGVCYPKGSLFNGYTSPNFRGSIYIKVPYNFDTGQFRRFTCRELKAATGNFKEELGRGGSGVVYRGVVDQGKVVAVKRLANVEQGDGEFWAEMAVIGRINHINLVRTWGFCSEGKHKMLVYEYVENESLDRHLFGTDRRPLPWNERYRIAVGTARGLAYLHHECLEWVIHCDVKPENILLTREFEAKIADFGLAKLSKRDGSGVQFSHIRGTLGYMAPEWALNLPINAKADVFSYGIVLLEILTGRRISEQRTPEGELLEVGQLAQALRQVVASGDVVSLVDSRMQGQFNSRQALDMLRISSVCLEEKRNGPTMDEIAKALTEFDDEDEHLSTTRDCVADGN
ncbi:unnamed protein product [Urochloa decumbens]|uniref:Receptor-like serine/threonine-protein kinase n=1 Tax=Urochloa decumbens TaxID=240449 RepID=A0ABC9H5I2_9POAL